MTEKLSANV